MKKNKQIKLLKQQNEELERNITELVLRPDSIKSLNIKHSVKFNVDVERAIWGGHPISFATPASATNSAS